VQAPSDMWASVSHAANLNGKNRPSPGSSCMLQEATVRGKQRPQYAPASLASEAPTAP
jgi:hypothetical protein